ncbi:MAG: hypothetical protein HY692_10175 [Cyanobacteria bacterium NC_groundwater_1444_Ag_S-0.65um_54_12]|nr:hypothetical protein [Cyanobacteria bacterium NC_groundwater_1444_Ag_S-0.65um_54_12]
MRDVDHDLPSTVAAAGYLQPRATSPALAGCLSFFIPGLGQLYVGQIPKGVLFMLLLLLGPATGFFSHLVLVIYATSEAFFLARRHRNGELVSHWGTLWDPTWRPFS